MNLCLFGDCRDSMRDLIAQGVKVQMCVTSPPYWGLRDYGTETWEGGDAECQHRGEPMRTKACINANCGTGNDVKNAAAMQFFRDICGKCGARRIDKQLGLESTPDEYVANMVEVFRLVRDLLADDGVLFLNLGDSYNGYMANQRGTGLEAGRQHSRKYIEPGAGLRTNTLKNKDLIGIPWRVAFALQADGWYLRQEIIWHKPNPMPESVSDRCTKAHEQVFLLSKSPRYYFDADAIREPSEGTDPCNPLGRNKRSVWTIASEPYSEAHFATFPTALVEPCILAGSRTGDIVFDPFLGSGTVGQVAQSLGRKWLGCELNSNYGKMQERRTAQMGMIL